MILLGHATTPDELELTTSAAGDIDVLVAYADMDDSLLPNAAVQEVNREAPSPITAATTTVLLTAPTNANYRRRVTEALIFNASATVTNTVTVTQDLNATGSLAPDVTKETLLPGEALQYAEGYGWFKRESKTALLRTLTLSADHDNSTTTATEVTGLSITTGLGTFRFLYELVFQTAATTTGIGVSVNHTGTATPFLYHVRGVSALTTAADGISDGDVALATGGTVFSNAYRVKSTAGGTAFAGVDTANSDCMLVVEGICKITADGDLELWSKSEVAASNTKIKSPTSLVLTRIGD